MQYFIPQVGDHSIVASWAGGVKGREVMDRLFPQIPHLLSPSGVFYLLALKENDFGMYWSFYSLFFVIIIHL